MRNINMQELETEVRQKVADAFEKAGTFVEDLRPVVQAKVTELRSPVVSFVTNTVDGALEVRERGENLAAAVSRDARVMRDQAEGWVRKLIA